MSSFLLVLLFLITKLLPNVNGQTALVESLPDTAFSASSSWGAANTPQSSKFSSAHAWAPADTNGAWLLIDLGLDYVITSISTIDSAGDHEYVKTYTLNYATNSNTFSVYPSIINANTKRNEEVNNILVPPFIARYLRFHPETYKEWPSMRVEIFGYIGTLPPTQTTSNPTPAPTNNPTQTTSNPTPAPTNNPTPAPTKQPTNSPTNNPTLSPTRPTSVPTPSPTNNPTPAPTNNPTPAPTKNPTNSPTNNPTPAPTNNPTPAPTNNPTPAPTTATPTYNPTIYPTTIYPTTSFPTTNYPTSRIPTTAPTRPPISGGEGEHHNSLNDYITTVSSLNIARENSGQQDIMVICFVFVYCCKRKQHVQKRKLETEIAISRVSSVSHINISNVCVQMSPTTSGRIGGNVDFAAADTPHLNALNSTMTQGDFGVIKKLDLTMHTPGGENMEIFDTTNGNKVNNNIYNEGSETDDDELYSPPLQHQITLGGPDVNQNEVRTPMGDEDDHDDDDDDEEDDYKMYSMPDPNEVRTRGYINDNDDLLDEDDL